MITTDGLENASREYSYERVKEMVERQKEKYGWEFLFLGANLGADWKKRIDEDYAKRGKGGKS